MNLELVLMQPNKQINKEALRAPIIQGVMFLELDTAKG